jgi:hypothetical protein
MKKIILLGFIYFLVVNSVFAQFDTIVYRFQNEFDQFKQSIKQEHQQFKNQNDSVFAKFLKDSWVEFDVIYNKKEGIPKPLVQPFVKEMPKTEPIEIEPAADSVKTNAAKHKGKEIKPAKGTLAIELGSSGSAMLNFDFYGTNSQVVHPGVFPDVAAVSSGNISAYFEKACNSPEINELVSSLKKTQVQLQLNDWGYFKLIEEIAKSVEENKNMQVLFSWMILLKSGYNAKVAYSKNDIYLLLPTQEEIFNSFVLVIDQIQYNIQTEGNIDQKIPPLQTYKGNYPENMSLSMAIKIPPLLDATTTNVQLTLNGKNVIIPNNLNLKDFYGDYPFCDISVYFSAPLSAPVIQSLENYFNPLLANQTKEQKVALLLEFVQSALAYKTDNEQFNREKYFFPDELFLYPFSDCEDRSILFFRLVKHFTDLHCIALNFPGHVNTAVCFSGEPKGDYLTLAGKNYIICDPTYKNAPIGYLDVQYKNQKPGIITFD